MTSELEAYLAQIRLCRICVTTPRGACLPHEPRPIVRAAETARLLIASQAPGVRAHKSGLPFDDPSGDRLRLWLGLDKPTFYDTACVAIAPMGFCFPGHDPAGGDLPPRPECQNAWHDGLFARLPNLRLVLAIGGYAQKYHFARLGYRQPKHAGVSSIVSQWRSFARQRPKMIPLPHPFWRNSGWLKRNPWFETELLPDLRAAVARALGEPKSDPETREDEVNVNGSGAR